MTGSVGRGRGRGGRVSGRVRRRRTAPTPCPHAPFPSPHSQSGVPRAPPLAGFQGAAPLGGVWGEAPALLRPPAPSPPRRSGVSSGGRAGWRCWCGRGWRPRLPAPAPGTVRSSAPRRRPGRATGAAAAASPPQPGVVRRDAQHVLDAGQRRPGRCRPAAGGVLMLFCNRSSTRRALIGRSRPGRSSALSPSTRLMQRAQVACWPSRMPPLNTSSTDLAALARQRDQEMTGEIDAVRGPAGRAAGVQPDARRARPACPGAAR